jgi:hypothetical protein
MDGGPIENKTYEMKLHGGTPFEKDVELPLVSEPKGMLAAFLPSQKTPRLNIRVWKMSNQALERLKYLSLTLVKYRKRSFLT